MISPLSESAWQRKGCSVQSQRRWSLAQHGPSSGGQSHCGIQEERSGYKRREAVTKDRSRYKRNRYKGSEAVTREMITREERLKVKIRLGDSVKNV